MNAKTEKLIDERTKTSLDPRHAPVSLPPGSFDIDALQKGLEGAVKAKPDERDEKVTDAVRKAASEETIASLDSDPATMAGFKTVDVEHPEIDGLVETTKVFDAKAAAKLAAADEPATAGETSTDSTTATKGE